MLNHAPWSPSQWDKLTFHQVAGMAISLTTSYVGHSSDLIIDTRCSWIVLLHCLWKTWWLLARLELTTYSSWRGVLSLTLPHSLIRGSRSDPHNPRLCFSDTVRMHDDDDSIIFGLQLIYHVRTFVIYPCPGPSPCPGPGRRQPSSSFGVWRSSQGRFLFYLW